jgi:hypothetical protein
MRSLIAILIFACATVESDAPRAKSKDVSSVVTDSPRNIVNGPSAPLLRIVSSQVRRGSA